jgi:hypothetical protein
MIPRGIEVVRVPEIASINDYNWLMIYDLWQFVETQHCLVVQADGFVINPQRWDWEFLDWDYIGAPWPHRMNSYIDPFGNHQSVGNGGFSLRSAKLLQVPQHIEIPWEVNTGDFYKHMDAGLYSEDGNICVHNRHLYMNQGCRFAPIEVASKFSRELNVPPWSISDPFGFHKFDPETGSKKHAPARAGWGLG